MFISSILPVTHTQSRDVLSTVTSLCGFVHQRSISVRRPVASGYEVGYCFSVPVQLRMTS